MSSWHAALLSGVTAIVVGVAVLASHAGEAGLSAFLAMLATFNVCTVAALGVRDD